ncbi:MAG: MBL fold metallo-hydrolase, partial [Candidatus Bathyarchaeia archaeon]
MSKPKITFYGGIGEIGGNKFLIEDKDARIFLDFGATFAHSSEYFSGFLQPRSVNGIGDYVEFGLLPKLAGLYAESYAQTANIRPRQPDFDAVFVSHAHIDHVGYVNFLHPDIPVYMGETCKIILDSVRETGGYDAGEGHFSTFRTGTRIQVGSITIEPIHVDHSVPGAYGFIVETSGGVIVYTGDLRLHGPMKKMTIEFLEKAREAKPVAILSEGTRIVDDSARFSEADVSRLSSAIVSKSKSLVISAFYGRDVDRINSFFRVAKEEGRTFVVPPKTAHLLTCLEKDKKLKTPRLTQ